MTFIMATEVYEDGNPSPVGVLFGADTISARKTMMRLAISEYQILSTNERKVRSLGDHGAIGITGGMNGRLPEDQILDELLQGQEDPVATLEQQMDMRREACSGDYTPLTKSSTIPGYFFENEYLIALNNEGEVQLYHAEPKDYDLSRVNLEFMGSASKLLELSELESRLGENPSLAHARNVFEGMLMEVQNASREPGYPKSPIAGMQITLLDKNGFHELEFQPPQDMNRVRRYG